MRDAGRAWLTMSLSVCLCLPTVLQCLSEMKISLIAAAALAFAALVVEPVSALTSIPLLPRRHLNVRTHNHPHRHAPTNDEL